MLKDRAIAKLSRGDDFHLVCYDSFRGDKDVCMVAVSKSGLALEYVSNEMKADIDIAKKAVFNDCDAINHVDANLLNNYSFVMDCLERHNFDEKIFKSAGHKISNDYNFVSHCLFKNGNLLRRVDPDLKKFNDICLTAVSQNPDAINYVPRSVDKTYVDDNLVDIAIKHNGNYLCMANPVYRDNDLNVLNAVSKDGLALEYASDRLKNHLNIVLLAVQQYGGALAYASKNLQDYHYVVLSAVNSSGRVLRYASDNLKANKEIVLTAVKQDPIAALYMNESMGKDRDIVKEILKHDFLDYSILEKMDNKFFKDKELMLLGLEKNSFIIELVDDSLKNDFNFMFELVKRDRGYLRFSQKFSQIIDKNDPVSSMRQYRNDNFSLGDDEFKNEVVNKIPKKTMKF